MLKILSLVVSFFLGRYEMTFKKGTLILIDQFITKSRKLFIFTTLLGITSLLFVSGLLMTIYQMTSQYDSRGYIAINSSLITGVVLATLSLVTLLGLFSATAWETRFKQQIVPAQQSKQKPSETPNPFEQALTMLVTEFVKDREMQRQTKSQSARTESFSQSHAESARPERTENPSHNVMN